ncbi:hypothetical protein [Streptomyces sp. NPDC101234]|uniref:hypothetical protein n=1 Tax=Streptomyces sp. NPDC101234 TaxID=3366138 RepID=UPI0038306CDE
MRSQATDTLLTSLAWRPPSPGHRLSGRSGEALPLQVYYRAKYALSHENPADPDVLPVYEDRFAVVTPRKMEQREEMSPPFDLIAMTHAGSRRIFGEYDVIGRTRAVRLT